MRILFWNTHRNVNINPFLSDLIIENDASIVVLAEYAADMDDLLLNLLLHGCTMRKYMSLGCERIQIIGRLDGVNPGTQTDYMSMQIIQNSDILCGIHLPSNIYYDAEERQRLAVESIISDICKKEEELHTSSTIIVGDFNMNPYARNCVGAPMFHGLPVYDDAARRSRVISGKEFYMFYNPMWRFLGDANQPYGTYYYDGSTINNTYWHIYDQVIIRPSLRDRFVDSSLNIITETGNRYLLDARGHPDKQISDHLPIIFEIMEVGNE